MAARRQVQLGKRGPVDDERDITPYEDPRQLPDYTEAQIQALRAVNRGTATQDQQARAMRYIVDVLLATYDMTYRGQSRHDDMLVAEGKRIAGIHLVYLLKHARTDTDIGKIMTQPQEEMG